MENEVKHIGLKVTGIVCGIIAGIVLLAVIFAFTVMPVIKYNGAEKKAELGDYATAAEMLRGMDYKDSEQKHGEYSLKAAEEYIEKGDLNSAAIYVSYAYNSKNKSASDKAEEYIKEYYSGQQ